MKKILSILVVTALVAMTMVSCKKDKDNASSSSGGGGGGGSQPSEAAAKTLVYDGVTYKLDCFYDIAENGRSYASGITIEVDDDGYPLYEIISDVEENTLNHTFDLTQQYEVDFFFEVRNADYTFQIRPEDFASGTLVIARDDALFTYKVTGKTNDGKDLAFHISVPYDEWNLPF